MPVDESEFPNLAIDGYRITSPGDARYNCIAWAAGVDNKIYDPFDDNFWPDDLPRDHHPSTLVMLYEGLGYDLCIDGSLEHGYEKIALYSSEDERVYEHAAIQLPDGRWSSKMGLTWEAEDIQHPRPESVAGGLYGKVTHFLRRKRESTAPKAFQWFPPRSRPVKCVIGGKWNVRRPGTLQRALK